MHDIKTRDVVSGTIKAVDRSTLAGQRMKDAYVQAKDKAEHSVYSSESNSEEYATNQITDGVSTVTREAVHQVDVLGQRILRPHGTQHSTQQSANQIAQQPHQTTDGASPANVPDIPAKDPKQVYIRNKQIRSVQTERRAKQRTQSTALPKTEDSKHIHNTVSSAERSVGIAGKSGKAIKTSTHTINTADQAVGASIKTAQTAFRAGQKAAIESAKTAQRTRKATKAAAAVARKAADYTARAAKAIAQAMQELISLVAAGGGTVLILVIVLVVMCFAGMMLASDEDDTEILPVSEEVKAYESIIQKYAKEHGIPDYVLLIEAVMMLESGGRGTDPMQCSECNFNTLYPHTPGSITDPEYSINVGIQNLADCLQIAQCESPVDMDAIKLALQGYNYGQGYITWAMNKYGKYSKANAIEFSLKTAEQLGWERYGNMNYVPLVLQYYPLGQIFYDPETVPLIVEVAASQIGNVGGEPYWRWYGFTERVGWCACFVSWCANECGYIDAGTFPRFSGPEWGVYWFRQHGQWVGRQTVPTPGMIIFYDWDNPETDGQDGVTDHVGIVSRVENGIVYTIEGNTIGDSCQERSHPIGDYQIIGYGVPAY